MANQLQVKVNQDSPRAESEGNWADLKGTKRGEVCVVDFFTEMVLEGRGFQSRAGTKKTSITMDAAAITDTQSEMSVTCNTSMTFLPFEVMINTDTQVGDAFECAGKSVPTLAAAGTLFTPLPLYSGGVASRVTAYTKTAGGCTVAGELATDTRQHFMYCEEFVGDDTNEEAVIGILWTPRIVPVCKGSCAFYVQIAAATAATYFSHINWLEMPTANIT